MRSASDDWVLLWAYAKERDENAFAELVRRHLNLVYSAATRRVGDRHLAEDVTQAVFVILANKAKSIRTSAPLSAWLLTTVRYAANNALKMEARRRKHEQRAAGPLRRAGSFAVGACSANPSDVLVWQEVARQLDDAVLRLSASDRRAVLLRFFENRPLSDIAADLNVSEGAAKQRLSRAIDKLRQRLGRRGVMVETIGPAALTTLLASHAVRAAPAGLMNSTCSAACGLATSATATSAAITIAKGAIHMMTWTQLKVSAALLAVVTLGAATGVITVKSALAQSAQPPAVTAKPQADAAAPAGALKRKDNMGIISVADAPPVIVSTTPQAGAADVDAAAVTEIKVVFSKDMEPGSFSWVQYGKDTFPKTTGKAHYENDKRTCLLPVKLEPGHPYVIWLNKAPYNNFTDTDGNKAVPYLLVFETK